MGGGVDGNVKLHSNGQIYLYLIGILSFSKLNMHGLNDTFSIYSHKLRVNTQLQAKAFIADVEGEVGTGGDIGGNGDGGGDIGEDGGNGINV